MTKCAEHILILIHFADPNDAVLDSTSPATVSAEIDCTGFGGCVAVMLSLSGG